ncbi:MAG: BrnT family toxin [Candidatus Limnocylindria bacterium]
MPTVRVDHSVEFEGLEFEWDSDKADEVERKHGITFVEALTVFFDPLAAETYDEEHSTDEDRYVTIGRTASEKVVVVVNTYRGSRIRLISARRPTPSEREAYEQGEGP